MLFRSNDVEEFYSKVQQIAGVNVKAVLVTSGSLQEGALQFARSKGIGVARTFPREQLEWVINRERITTISLFDHYKNAITQPDFIGENKGIYVVDGQCHYNGWQSYFRDNLIKSGYGEFTIEKTSSHAIDRYDDDKNALDDLFQRSLAFRKSDAYFDMLKFVAKFPVYKPFNRLLLYTQNPNVSYVATPGQWERDFNRRIRPDEYPLIVLQPFAPVLFVYDLSQTEGDDESLPEILRNPFRTSGKFKESIFEKTLINLTRDRIAYAQKEFSEFRAGSLAFYSHEKHFHLVGNLTSESEIRYIAIVNEKFDLLNKYSSLVHELAHLYCGHFGGDEFGAWDNRSFLSEEEMELEAESVTFLVCNHLGIQTNSEEYLAEVSKRNNELPQISVMTVLQVAGRIEEMGEKKLPLHKNKTKSKE